MNIRLPARIGGFACLGVALAMGLLAMREAPKPSSPPASPSAEQPEDPLRSTLRRCQAAGMSAGSDPGCLAAWAENRRRFLGQPPAQAGEPAADSAPGKSSEPAIVANDAVFNIRQE